MLRHLSGFTLLALSLPLWADTSETVFTLSDDLQTATKYFSNRSDNPGSFSFLFEKDFASNQITYARPEGYQWQSNHRSGGKVFKRLYFPNTSSYAYLQRQNNKRDGFLEKDAQNPNRYYLVVDGSRCMGDGCETEESIVSVIVPKRFKVLNYKAKVDGEWLDWQAGDWKVIDGTYTFYRRRLQGAMVVLHLEDAASYGYTRMTDAFSANKNIEVSNEGNRIRVVMPLDKLFASGSADMAKDGLNWLKTLQATLKDMNYQELRVEGHTDNVPIVRKAGSGPANNWDLSSARAANIVRYLIAEGVAAERIAAVGYADTRPRSSNDSVEGRQRNRRVEFSIVTSESATASLPAATGG